MRKENQNKVKRNPKYFLPPNETFQGLMPQIQDNALNLSPAMKRRAQPLNHTTTTGASWSGTIAWSSDYRKGFVAFFRAGRSQWDAERIG
jgi:hypothetical protein